MAGRHKPKNRL